MKPYEIAFAGAGKVASALCDVFHSKGCNISSIVSVNREKGEMLASRYGAAWSDRPVFDKPLDIIIVAVPDHKLKDILSVLVCPDETIVAHTAGSFGLEVFPPNIRNKAVFYPLQTFSPGRKIDFGSVPVFIESESSESDKVLRDLGSAIGSEVFISNLKNRQLLHAAAVFVSNFTNYMLTSGKDISEKAGYKFDILKPLILETINKALEKGPVESQTGPALRGDKNTIEKHSDLLSFSPGLKDIYLSLSESIMNYYKEKEG